MNRAIDPSRRSATTRRPPVELRSEERWEGGPVYEALFAETIFYRGDGGDGVEAYFARPFGPGPYPSLVVVHHMPGWDEMTKEITRKFAHHGFVTICPNLYTREGGGTMSPDDAAAAARLAGGVPDSRFLADTAGAIELLRLQAYTSNKVGIIGYCAGGRQAYLAACNLPLDAAVTCYGGRIVAGPDQLDERHPVAPIDYTASLDCPLLGLFGAEDVNPSPDQVKAMEDVLRRSGKRFEFHTYEGAGHGFFSTDRPGYRVEAANDGWVRVLSFFDEFLRN